MCTETNRVITNGKRDLSVYPMTSVNPHSNILNLTCWTGGLCMPSFKVMLTCLKSWAALEWLGKKLSKVKRTFSITSWFLAVSLKIFFAGDQTPLLCFKILNFGFQNKTTRHGKSTQQIAKPRTAQSILQTQEGGRVALLASPILFEPSQQWMMSGSYILIDGFPHLKPMPEIVRWGSLIPISHISCPIHDKKERVTMWLGDSCLFD